MKKIEHLGIAVKDLEEGERLFQKLFNTAVYKREQVAPQNVITSFLRMGPNKIELLASTTEDGVIAKYIEKHGPGLHHVAFEVTDIHSEMDRLKMAGFQLLSDKPSRGADNKWVCFIHPKSAGGVLIELVQEIKT